MYWLFKKKVSVFINACVSTTCFRVLKDQCTVILVNTNLATNPFQKQSFHQPCVHEFFRISRENLFVDIIQQKRVERDAFTINAEDSVSMPSSADAPSTVDAALDLNTSSRLKCGKKYTHFFTITTFLTRIVLVNHHYWELTPLLHSTSLELCFIYSMLAIYCSSGFLFLLLLWCPLGIHWLTCFCDAWSCVLMVAP